MKNLFVLTICALFILSTLAQNSRSQSNSRAQTKRPAAGTGTGSRQQQQEQQLTEQQVRDVSLRCFLNCAMDVDMNELEMAKNYCLFFDRTRNCFDQRISPLWVDFKQCIMPCMNEQAVGSGTGSVVGSGTGSPAPAPGTGSPAPAPGTGSPAPAPGTGTAPQQPIGSQ